MILYAAPVKEKIKEELIERLKKLKKQAVLAIVQVGNLEESNVYIKQKQKFGEEIGVKVVLHKLPGDISVKELGAEIKKLNEDASVDGMIIQLPLPESINTQEILNLIKKEKDADGLNGGEVIPATVRAVLTILDFYNFEIKGKKVAVIGLGILAGKPISQELEKKGAEVFRCDISTRNIPEITRECDILISAVGKAGLITKEFVNSKQVVIDVGISKTSPPTPLTLRGESEEKTNPLVANNAPKLVGDVDFAQVEPLVLAITPVPGGVGPLTVVSLFQNLVDLCE